MGMHVSYHPFSPAGAHGLYFDDLGRGACVERVALQMGSAPEASARLRTLLSNGGCARPAGMSRYEARASNMTMVSALLHNCWYTSDCRFSTLLEPADFSRYATDWRRPVAEAIVRERSDHESGVNRDGGIVFLSCEGLKRLRVDHAENAAMRSQLSRAFPRGWLPVFWAAVDHAVARECGLIEAVNLVRPDAIAPSSLMV